MYCRVVDSETYYYEIGEGRWQGQFRFRITDWGGFFGAQLGLRHRALAVGLDTLGRLPGQAQMRAEILCDPLEGEAGVARVEVSVHRFGLEVYRLRGHYALQPDGHGVHIHIVHRYGPPGMAWYEKPAKAHISDNGMTATYQMRLVGHPFEGQYRVQPSRRHLKALYACDWAHSEEEMYRTVPQVPKAPAPRGRWQALLDVARQVESLGRDADLNDDPVAAFCHVYAYFLRELAYRVEGAGFEDPDWVVRLGKAFVLTFLSAMQRLKEQDSPNGWRIVLTLLSSRRLTVLDELGLCMLVHITHDLPIALEQVGLFCADGRPRIADYHRVNLLLEGAVNDLQDRLSSRYNPLAGWLDRRLGDMDERLTRGIIQYGRSTAWYDAQRLLDPAQASGVHRELEQRLRDACSSLQGDTRATRRALSLTRRWVRAWRRTPKHPESAQRRYGAAMNHKSTPLETLLGLHTGVGHTAGRTDLRGLKDALQSPEVWGLLSPREREQLETTLDANTWVQQLVHLANAPQRWSVAAELLRSVAEPMQALKQLGIAMPQAQQSLVLQDALMSALRLGFDAAQDSLQEAIEAFEPAEAIVSALDNKTGGYDAHNDVFEARAAAFFPVAMHEVKAIVDPERWDEVITQVEDARWLHRDQPTQGLVYERVNVLADLLPHHPLVMENELFVQVVEEDGLKRVQYKLHRCLHGGLELDEGFIELRALGPARTVVLIEKRLKVRANPLLYALLRFNPDGLSALLTDWIHQAAANAG